MIGPLETASVPVEAQVEAMRHMLRVVLEELRGTEVAFNSLDALIAELLCDGVTPQEIAFLIAETTPFRATQRQDNLTLAATGN